MGTSSLPKNVKPDGGANVMVGKSLTSDATLRTATSEIKTEARVYGTIWNQAAPALPTSPFGYGRRFETSPKSMRLSKPLLHI